MRRIMAAAVGVALLAVAATVTGFAATLGVDSGTIDTFSDYAGATTTTTTAPSGDTSAPALVSLEMFDVDTDGRVDQVKAAFGEALADYTAGNTPWTLSNVPSGGSLASVSVSGTVATLTITEGNGAEDTAVGSFTVALAQDATGIRDAAGNKASFAAAAPLDRARPMPVGLMIANGASGSNSTGTPQEKDRVSVQWSEVLAPNTLCSTASGDFNLQGGQYSVIVHLDDNAAPITSNDRLRVTVTAAHCGGRFNFGYVDLGSPGFVAQDTVFEHNGNGNATSIGWVGATRTLTITLGAGTGQRVNASVTATYHPSSGITDAATNPASRSTQHSGVQF